MDPDVILSLGIAAGSSITAALGLGFAWYRATLRNRELESHLRPGTTGSAASDDVVHQVEAMARQVEALREGQDFLMRVLAQAPPQAQVPPAPGAPARQHESFTPRAAEPERTPR